MRDARQEQDMPETTTPVEREQSPSGTEDAAIGVRKETELAAELLSAEAETETKANPAAEKSETLEIDAPEVAEEDPLAPLDSADETSIREFAQSVMSGLEDAGIDIGADEEPEQSAALDLPEEEEPDFFAGWDGLLDEERSSAAEAFAEEQEQVPAGRPFGEPAQPFEEPLVGTKSLAEIGAAASFTASEDEPEAENLSSKHDELADAVQSALFSIYGDPAPAMTPPPPAASVFAAEPSAAARWNTPDAGDSADDGLTPQEVILNYFSYDPKSGKSGEAPAPLNGAAADDGDAGEDYFDRDPFFSPERQPQWPSSFARQGSYDGPPSYPAPALATPRSEAHSERESSRLLGAAAIGLIGGIAIAASLAVFVISSYGPGERGGVTAPSRAVDAAGLGYGRNVRAPEGSETPKAADAPAVDQQVPAVAVADVVATPGQASPLSIAVKSDASAEQALVSITGVPDGARLTAGVDAGDGNWLLPPHRLKGLSINVSSAASGTFLLGVQLVDSNVRTPLSDKKQFTLRVASAKPEAVTLIPAPRPAPSETASLREPQNAAPQLFAPPSFNTQTIPAPAVAAPPPEPQAPAADVNFRTQTVAASAAQQPAAPRLTSLAAPVAQQRGAPQTEIEDLIREGNKRMREGDILEARALYQKAVVNGDPEAALAMGRSYDPIYFSRIDKKNAEPDAAKAFDWYRKAMDAGAAQTAKVRIENLKHFLNE
jgi:hypothetical protein